MASNPYGDFIGGYHADLPEAAGQHYATDGDGGTTNVEGSDGFPNISEGVVEQIIIDDLPTGTLPHTLTLQHKINGAWTDLYEVTIYGKDVQSGAGALPHVLPLKKRYKGGLRFSQSDTAMAGAIFFRPLLRARDTAVGSTG